MSSMEKRIEEVLERVRPALQRHGGGVEFVAFDPSTGIVRVRLSGTCRGCPLASLTLKAGVESLLREAIPEITEVIAVP